MIAFADIKVAVEDVIILFSFIIIIGIVTELITLICLIYDIPIAVSMIDTKNYCK